MFTGVFVFSMRDVYSKHVQAETVQARRRETVWDFRIRDSGEIKQGERFYQGNSHNRRRPLRFCECTD